MSPFSAFWFVALSFGLASSSGVVASQIIGLRGTSVANKPETLATENLDAGPKQRRLNAEFFRDAGQAMTEDGPTVGTDNQEALQAKEECPEHAPSEDLYYCTDPTLDYEIPCQEANCLFDLSVLDGEAPPGLCAYVALDTDNLLNAESIPDKLKPCVIWEISFGDMNGEDFGLPNGT
jgi:hypothetical protein